MAAIYRRTWLAALFVHALSVCAAQADSAVDAIEHVFGATNINAVTGSGRLAAGVSSDGDVTVLSCPSPSYADQLGYLSSNDFHARALARFGAPEGAGLFLGLLVERQDGGREVTWLRDRSRWRIEQSYGEDDGPNIVTRHQSTDLGLSVSVVDAVRPPNGGADVLVRLASVAREAASPVTAAWLLTYANLSPTPPNSRIPEGPIVDWLFDGTNDFAAVWDAAAAAVVHFHPRDQLVYQGLNDLLAPPRVMYGAVGEQLKAGTPTGAALAALAGALDDEYAAGSYIALATRPTPDEHQIGFDATPWCALRDTLADNVLALPAMLPGSQPPLDPTTIDVFRCRGQRAPRETEGWTYDAADALQDASDGELQGSGIAAGEVNEALRTPLSFEDIGGASVARAAVLLSCAPTAAEARAGLAAIAAPEQVALDATAALAAWLQSVRLPESGPAEVRAVARRALINLRVGTDAATGAIVASIARQPPYYLDWARDGTFFNVTLDVAGQADLVGRRADLYITWQRSRPVRPTIADQPPPRDPTTGAARTYPADAWEMNYYPDGTVGGPIRFEIDNTALALWSIVTHVGWIAADATAYLSQRWAAIARAANLLARWRDPGTGLQAPANEDDNAVNTQTLHGAVAVYGALEVAARAARFLGRDDDAGRWERRACELRDAILGHLYDPQARRFVRAPGDTFSAASAPTGDTAWLVWPTRVLPWDDSRIGEQILSDLQIITPTVRLETEGGAYFMKNTVAAALARGTDPVVGPLIADLRDRIALTHATPNTRHFGEAMLTVEGEHGPLASQRVATPHLWEGALFYLTAMALEDPRAFDRQDAVLPPSRVPAPGVACAPPTRCVGDCDSDGGVTVNELLTGAGIILGESSVGACPSLAPRGDGSVTIRELLAAVNNALRGCAF